MKIKKKRAFSRLSVRDYAVIATPIANKKIDALTFFLSALPSAHGAQVSSWTTFLTDVRRHVPALVAGPLPAAKGISDSCMARPSSAITGPRQTCPTNRAQKTWDSCFDGLQSAEEALRYIFDYSLLLREVRQDLINNNITSICQYCEEQSIRTIFNVDMSPMRVTDLDHWYSQKNHPALRLNYHNLIPSCAKCNTIKRDYEFADGVNFYPPTNGSLPSHLSWTVGFSSQDKKVNTGLRYKVIATDRSAGTGVAASAERTANKLGLIGRYEHHEELIHEFMERSRILSNATGDVYADIASQLGVPMQDVLAILRGGPFPNSPDQILESFRRDLAAQFL